MIPLIADNIDAIRDVCRKHHLKYLFLFGSALNEQSFRKESDVDFLYEIDIEHFDDWDKGDYDYIDNLNDLENNLQRLLSRQIDLIPYAGIRNQYFKQSVDANRLLIYGQ